MHATLVRRRGDGPLRSPRSPDLSLTAPMGSRATITPSVRAASPELARRQGRWIATLEPWLGLGYSAAGLGRFLARAARAGQVLVIDGHTARARPAGVMVLQPNVLLGSFVSLLAVRPDVARQGLGRALLAAAEARTFSDRRW